MNWKTKFSAILSVYLILINDQEEVLLLRRKNTGYKDGELGLPAGHVDGGEDLFAAMKREAMEEVGVEVEAEDLELKHVLHRNCGDHERVDFFFTCRIWKGESTNIEPEKCSELKWVPFDDLPEDFIDYYQHCFNKIRDGDVVSGYGWNN